MALIYSLPLNICEWGFDFPLAYVSTNEELLQRSCLRCKLMQNLLL